VNINTHKTYLEKTRYSIPL